MREPIIGEKIYVPTSLYVYRGADDFEGGLATIKELHPSKNLPLDHCNYMMVTIEERPNTQYNWAHLLENQEEWSERYAGRIAHPDPDDRPEFNDDNTDWK